MEETAAFVSDTERERKKAEESESKIENKEEKENGWGNVCGFFVFFFFARRKMRGASVPRQTLSYIYKYICVCISSAALSQDTLSHLNSQ